MHAITDLLHSPFLWRAGELSTGDTRTVPSGYPTLDPELPGGGWPLGALTEILGDTEGCGEVSLLLPALTHERLAGRGLLWVDPPHLPYAPALQNAGIPLAQCRVALPESTKDNLWVTEQALRSGACGAVLAWIESDGRCLSFTALRRLHAAATQGRGLAFLFRPVTVEHSASPAVLRLRIAAEIRGLRLHIIKRRGPPLARSPLLNVREARWPNGIASGAPLSRVTASIPQQAAPMPGQVD